MGVIPADISAGAGRGVHVGSLESEADYVSIIKVRMNLKGTLGN